MADRYANAFDSTSEARIYPFPGAPAAQVAEPPGQYKSKIRGGEWPREIRRIEVRALSTAASGQFARLYQLANLLLQPKPANRSAAELEHHAGEIRRAARELEDILHAIVDPLVETPESDEPDED